MSDKPIIFSAPMVRALLDGRKTQTRRVLKPPYGTLEYLRDGTWRPICTKFFKGDRLYVRETFSYEVLDVDRNGFMPPWYWADGNPQSGDFTRPKPSIHMPRWASRLTLTVTDVRVQRLQEISEADARDEGVEPIRHEWWQGFVRRSDGTRGMMEVFGADGPPPDDLERPEKQHYERSAVQGFSDLWNSLHGPDAWDANPWVVALTFTVHHGNIDTLGAA